MEGFKYFGLLYVLCLSALSSAQDKNIPVYVAVGGTLDVTPVFSNAITRIVWKIEGDLVAEWSQNGNDFTYYGRFDGRTVLDPVNGRLKIKNVSNEDIRNYAVEINSVAQPQVYVATLIKEVPVPEVVLQPLICKAETLTCTVACTGKFEGAQPVTYSWGDDGKWRQGEAKFLLNETFRHVTHFTCRVTNPVSERDSKPFQNPINRPDPPPTPVGLIVGLIFLFLIIGGGSVGAYMKRDEIKDQWNSFRAGRQGVPTHEPPNGTAGTESKPV